ncbi:MAG: PilN domain-containing protein [Candidatus Nealsonbacteria bacterium]
MINLLPPKERDILRKEEKLRLAFIWGIFVLFFLATFSLVLFSVNIYLAGEVRGFKILVDCEQQKSATLEAQNIEKEISAVNQNLTTLAAFYEGQSRITELLQKISEIIPEGIYLNSLSLNPNKDKKDRFQISLTGHSGTREALLDFKKSLESKSSFQGVYFPPSSWVKPSDINFSASFEMTL